MYEYQCQDCGQRFERLSWGQEGKVRCTCGSEQAQRIWYSRVALGSSGGDAEGGGMDCEPGGGECCGGGACGMNDDFDA